VKNHSPVEYAKSEDTWTSSQDEEQALPRESDRDIQKADIIVDSNEVNK
jgi:hypothetical protein